MFLGELMSSPNFYPLGVDFAKRVVSFARMSRDDYRNAAFLDFFARKNGYRLYSVNLDDLLLHQDSLPTKPSNNPVHYILHSAFCCSTLLARYVELIPNCFILKEPTFLSQAAFGYRPSLTIPDPTSEIASRHNWLQTLRLCVGLFARTFSPGEVVIIKTTDLCNLIGDDLLMLDDRSRIASLSTGLRAFILSVLKLQRRRSWVCQRLVCAKRNAGAFPILATLDLTELADAEAAACLWLYYKILSRDLGAKWGTRVTNLVGEQVAETPTQTLGAIVKAFQLPVETNQLTKLLADSSVGSRYSKNVYREYDSNSRRSELTQLEIRFGKEADEGIRWTLACMDRLGLDDDVIDSPCVRPS